MPLYEYRCSSCSHRFEWLTRGTGTPRCPACDSASLERQLSVFAAHTGPSSRTTVTSPAPCGSCGDLRGPGACSIN